MNEKTKDYLISFIKERIAFTALSLNKIDPKLDSKTFLEECNKIESEIAEEILHKVTNEVIQEMREEL